MADLFGILKNKALLMTLSKDDIQTLLDTLESSMNQGDASALTQAKSYTDQKIAALPAGGIYQPISHLSKTVTFSTNGVASISDIIDTDSDMFILSISGIRGSFQPKTNEISPSFSFGFDNPAPGLSFRSFDNYTVDTLYTFNQGDLNFSLRSVYSRVTHAEMTVSPKIYNNDTFVSCDVLNSGDSFDFLRPLMVKPLRIFVDGESEPFSVCAIVAKVDVYNYRLDV